MPANRKPSPDGGRGRGAVIPAVATVVALLVVAIIVWRSARIREDFSDVFGFMLAGDPEPLRLWLLEFEAWAPLLSLLVYVLSALIPILPGFPLAIANAMLFGALLGGVLSFVSAAAAAATCFGIARILGRPGVVRIASAERLARMDRFMERRGLFAVFAGRLIPFINPDLLSYAAGVTGMRWVPFLVAMAAGAVPATVFYSLVGAYALEATGWVIGVVAAATLLPLLFVWFYRDRIMHWQMSGDSEVSGSDSV